ncbi:hypothetical protein C0J52_19375 [Blattella germanica]|nr:hypothetical protein C0J52_19375 [Blattella germanica]
MNFHLLNCLDENSIRHYHGKTTLRLYVERFQGLPTFLLRKLRTSFTPYFALFHTHIQYCLHLWGLASNSKEILKYQKIAIRIMLHKKINEPCRPLFVQLKMLTVYRKGLGDLDVYYQDPSRTLDGSNGNIACNSYYKYKDDIAAIKMMGLTHYRFSIAWSRIMPTGLVNNINQKGIDYYNKVIDLLLENGIIPVVQMYHFDLPNYLELIGGWTNEALIPYFVDYARVLFQNFGDRVKWWSTFNEPINTAFGYERDIFPPGVNFTGIGPYLVSHTILKAHARTYHLYNDEFREMQQGYVSITLPVNWAIPKDSNSPEDVQAAKRNLQFTMGWWAHPIYSEEGDYPQVMKDIIENLSIQQGFTRSRLRTFTPEEVQYIKGTSDYFSINEYTAFIVTSNNAGHQPSYQNDRGTVNVQPNKWPISKFGLYYVNFTDPERPRTPKQSTYFMRDVIESWSIPEEYYIQDQQIAELENLKANNRGSFSSSSVLGEDYVGTVTNLRQAEDRHTMAAVQTLVLLLLMSLQLALTSEVNSISNNDKDYIDDENDKYNFTFPPEFQIGVASAAYQYEGAWNEGGKGESIWDRFVHTSPEAIIDLTNGDEATDFYHKYKEDIQLIKDLGEGLDFYDNVLNELIKHNIIPMVTMYHWDLPQHLQELGGWANSAVIDYFEDYADLLFKYFGDRVKWWITINEPTKALEGYGGNVTGSGYAPNVSAPGIGTYLAGHNMLLAHARAYHLYNEKYREKQKGYISMALETFWYEPLNPENPSDHEAVNQMLEFNLGWFANPIFSEEGDYPKVMREKIALNSRKEGFRRSRLPVFTKEEIEYITPKGLRKLLKYIKDKYGKKWKIVVTENGYIDDGRLVDVQRMIYLGTYMMEMWKAMYLDGVDVMGYMIWSLLDNMEWTSGYKSRSGIYHVDFNHPDKIRTAKQSTILIKNITTTRCIPRLYSYFLKELETLEFT